MKEFLLGFWPAILSVVVIIAVLFYATKEKRKNLKLLQKMRDFPPAPFKPKPTTTTSTTTEDLIGQEEHL